MFVFRRQSLLLLIPVLVLAAACGADTGSAAPDSTPPKDQDGTSDPLQDDFLDVGVKCEPLMNALDTYLTPIPLNADSHGPVCTVTAGGGTPAYDVTLEVGNTDATVQVTRFDDLPGRVESVSFHVQPRPPGLYAVIATAADTEGRESSAVTALEWAWSDPEQIAVNVLDPAAGIQVERGETLSFAAEFDAPDFVTPRLVGLDENLQEIAFDILSDIRRYEVVWDFHDGTVERETFDVSKGTSSFFHTFDETGDHLVTVTVTDQLFKMTGTDRLTVEVVESGGLEPQFEWRLQESRIAPSEARGEEGQAGAFWRIEATGSNMSLTSRHVAYGEEVNTVSMEFTFTPPPSVLTIGETYTINVTGTAITTGTLGPGYRWTFTAPYPATGPTITLNPRGGENGSTESYSFVARDGKEGDTLQISATVDGLRCEVSTPCRVQWVYELVPAS